MAGDPPKPDDPNAKTAPVRVAAAKCVRCSQPVQPRYRPFCSQRCADIDLGSWFSDRYRVPTDERPAEGEEPDKS
jgi:endogenous inhibitor of DNA gyrase (YacG/DUF329 family)